MKRSFTRLLLSLFFLLLSGHNYLSAHYIYSRAAIIEKAAASVDNLQGDQVAFSKHIPLIRKKRTSALVDTTDSDDDDHGSLKDGIAPICFHAAFFHATVSHLSYNTVNSRLPISGPVLYLSTSRFILFRVIRI